MENTLWIDLGLIGHRSNKLRELFAKGYLTEVPIQNSILDFTDYQGEKFVVFMDYTMGGSGEKGTKVFTNAFRTENEFVKILCQKLIIEYVEIDKSLDFNSNF